jgi:transposase-like protein
MAVAGIDKIGDLLHEAFSNREGLRHFLETVVNIGMREEAAAHLGAAEHERNKERRGYRNGTKPRRLKTRVGELDLLVPQVRNYEPYHPSMFARWQRSERALMVACGEMYFQGVSTRNVQNVLQEMCGLEISSATVSRVAAELDEKLLAFADRRLGHTAWKYLMIDARYEKIRVGDKVISQGILVTIGFTVEGKREILDWRVADSESEESWGSVFRNLKDRGLGAVELVVSDAHSGIRAAIARHLQGTSWQRCVVHFKREMGKKVGYKKLKELNRDLTTVFAPEEKSECVLRAQEMAMKWETTSPAVAAMLRDSVEDCLTVLSFPSHHRKRLKSTNLLENIMKRLKKRTKVVGVFPNRASCHRLVGAQLLELHEEWQTESRDYFNTEYAGA